MTVKLWHDDVRPPPDPSWDVWARTNEAAKEFLVTGCVREISMDHDMGLHGIEIPEDPDEFMDLIYSVGPAQETGLDLVHWMVETGFVPETITIHSWNPDGAKTMAARLNRFGHDVRIAPYTVPRR